MIWIKLGSSSLLYSTNRRIHKTQNWFDFHFVYVINIHQSDSRGTYNVMS